MVPAEQRFKSFECALIEGFLIASKIFHEHPSGKQLLFDYTERIEDDNTGKEERNYLFKVKKYS